MEVADLEMKLFVSDFFDRDSIELVKGWKHYDFSQGARNQIFVQHVFRNPASILPIQNLGEISLLLPQKPMEAFSYLDMSVQMFKQLQPDNTQQYKSLTLLGILLDREGQQQPSHNLFKAALNGLEPFKEVSEKGQCYERPYVMWNYGQLLSRNESTRLEGRDYLAEAERLFHNYNHWAERKMNYFVPSVTLDEFDG